MTYYFEDNVNLCAEQFITVMRLKCLERYLTNKRTSTYSIHLSYDNKKVCKNMDKQKKPKIQGYKLNKFTTYQYVFNILHVKNK